MGRVLQFYDGHLLVLLSQQHLLSSGDRSAAFLLEVQPSLCPFQFTGMGAARSWLITVPVTMQTGLV
jgi:hypothetical protein